MHTSDWSPQMLRIGGSCELDQESCAEFLNFILNHECMQARRVAIWEHGYEKGYEDALKDAVDSHALTARMNRRFDGYGKGMNTGIGKAGFRVFINNDVGKEGKGTAMSNKGPWKERMGVCHGCQGSQGNVMMLTSKDAGIRKEGKEGKGKGTARPER